MNALHFYKVLKIPFGSSLQEVKQAYKSLVKKWHPDLFLKSPPHIQANAQEKLTQINLAYNKLSIALKKFPKDQPLNFYMAKEQTSSERSKKQSKTSGFSSPHDSGQTAGPRVKYPEETITLSNGDVYVGQVFNGKMHGKGTYRFSNGDVYVGDFLMNERHGKGTYTHIDGSKYVGHFKNGRPYGQGTYYYDNGDRYVGMFVNDQMHGHGTYEYVNGDHYTGQYKNGQPHGRGTYFTANGRQLSGNWENGKLMP